MQLELMFTTYPSASNSKYPMFPVIAFLSMRSLTMYCMSFRRFGVLNIFTDKGNM